MRKNKKGLVPSLACGFGAVGATAIVLGAAASSFVGKNVISEDAELSGASYNSGENNEAALLALDGTSSVTGSTITASGANSMSVAMQNNATLSVVNSTVINSGTSGTAFLIDSASGSLNVVNSSVSSTGNLVAVQNSRASLNLISNTNANGSILVDSSSLLYLSMTNGNQFIGSINALDQGSVSLNMSADSVLYLTGNSFLSSLTDEAADYSNIYLCGYTLTVNGELIAGNNADCGDLVGGYGQPTIIPDGYDPNPTPPAPDPQPEPQPEPKPEPQPQPEPTPTPSKEPVYYEPQVVSPNTGDGINSRLFVMGAAFMGLGLCLVICAKSLNKNFGR